MSSGRTNGHGPADGSRGSCGKGWRRVALILNPYAGRGAARRRVDELAAAAEHALGCRVNVSLCDSRLPEAVAAECAAAGCDLLIAAGGDGTLGSVVNGSFGSGIPIGLVPLGTGNDFARAVGIPLQPLAAIRGLARYEARNLDVGARGTRRFINVAGCGFDAVVAERVNRGTRMLRRSLAYLAAVMQTLATFRPAMFDIVVDEVEFRAEAMMCAVANGTGYGGGMQIAPEARCDDGLLDVCLVLSCSKLEFLRAFPRVFRGQHLSHPKVRMFRGREIVVRCTPAQPVLMDGELCEPTPVRFVVEAGAVPVLVPTTASGR